MVIRPWDPGTRLTKATCPRCLHDKLSDFVSDPYTSAYADTQSAIDEDYIFKQRTVRRNKQNPKISTFPYRKIVTQIETLLHRPIMTTLHQHSIAQPGARSSGHATRAGPTEQQPEKFHYDFSKGGEYGFPQPPKFDDKYQEREFIKGRLAAAFRIFGENKFDEGVAGHITARVSLE